MAAKKTFLESMEPLDARMQLAALVSPRELQSLSASCLVLKSLLYGNRDCLLRASLESHYRAQQTTIIDLLNAPKADSKDIKLTKKINLTKRGKPAGNLNPLNRLTNKSK